jgi:hypothetical protein
MRPTTPSCRVNGDEHDVEVRKRCTHKNYHPNVSSYQNTS